MRQHFLDARFRAMGGLRDLPDVARSKFSKDFRLQIVCETLVAQGYTHWGRYLSPDIMTSADGSEYWLAHSIVVRVQT